jgi:hypothetical protein
MKKKSNCGKKFCFHGAFASKAKARARERRVGGFIRKISVCGHRRFVVMSRKKK